MPRADSVACTALVVDDDGILRERLAKSLEWRGWAVRQARDVMQALEAARRAPVDMAIVDLRLPGRSGLDILSGLRDLMPRAFILILTAYGSIATALQATKLDADHYLGKPADAVQILACFPSFRSETSGAFAAEGAVVPSLPAESGLSTSCYTPPGGLAAR
jgi:two-component system response regulator RegA